MQILSGRCYKNSVLVKNYQFSSANSNFTDSSLWNIYLPVMINQGNVDRPMSKNPVKISYIRVYIRISCHVCGDHLWCMQGTWHRAPHPASPTWLGRVWTPGNPLWHPGSGHYLQLGALGHVMYVMYVILFMSCHDMSWYVMVCQGVGPVCQCNIIVV